MINYISYTLVYFCPLMIAALAGMITEKGGVTNIALDGLMIFGSFAGLAVFNSLIGDAYSMSAIFWGVYILALLVSILSGMLISIIHAFASVKLKADQIISATTFNMFATALATFIAFSITIAGKESGHVIDILAPTNSGSYFYIKVGDFIFYPSLIVGIIVLALLMFVLKYTRYGLRMRAAGENPYALASAGMDVDKYRWSGVLLSGALASLAGFVYLTTMRSEFQGDVGGMGFLALAMMIGGNWNGWLIALFTLVFSAVYNSTVFLNSGNIYSSLIQMIPYIAAILLSIIVSKIGHQPAADGVPYYRERK